MVRFCIVVLAIVAGALAQDNIYNFRCGNIQSEDVKNAEVRKRIDAEYIKGDTMFLCLHIAPFGLRLPYRLVVDEYNMIELRNCKNFDLPQSHRCSLPAVHKIRD